MAPDEVDASVRRSTIRSYLSPIINYKSLKTPPPSNTFSRRLPYLQTPSTPIKDVDHINNNNLLSPSATPTKPTKILTRTSRRLQINKRAKLMSSTETLPPAVGKIVLKMDFGKSTISSYSTRTPSPLKNEVKEEVRTKKDKNSLIELPALQVHQSKVQKKTRPTSVCSPQSKTKVIKGDPTTVRTASLKAKPVHPARHGDLCYRHIPSRKCKMEVNKFWSEYTAGKSKDEVGLYWSERYGGQIMGSLLAALETAWESSPKHPPIQPPSNESPPEQKPIEIKPTLITPPKTPPIGKTQLSIKAPPILRRSGRDRRPVKRTGSFLILN